MAAVSATLSTADVTLSGTTVDTVTMGQDADRWEIENVSGAESIEFTYGDSTVGAPTDEAAETRSVRQGQSLTIRGRAGNRVFKLIGSSNVYKVTGYAGH